MFSSINIRETLATLAAIASIALTLLLVIAQQHIAWIVAAGISGVVVAAYSISLDRSHHS